MYTSFSHLRIFSLFSLKFSTLFLASAFSQVFFFIEFSCSLILNVFFTSKIIRTRSASAKDILKFHSKKRERERKKMKRREEKEGRKGMREGRKKETDKVTFRP